MFANKDHIPVIVESEKNCDQQLLSNPVKEI